MIPNQRHKFEIPDEITYLNCAYLTPQLKSVTAAGVDGMGSKIRPWETEPDDFFDTGERVRANFAELTGVDADGVALIPAVSYGVSVAAANVQVDAGQNIVVLDEQFPSNVYPWWHVAADRGAEIVTVPREPGAWTPRILEAIDERTAVVAVPQCHWTDGAIIDLGTVADASRAVGASLVVDASQSLGAFPLDLERVRPDFLVTVGYKWLLGPYRSAYLWVAPDRRDGVPIEHGWVGRAGARDFSRLVDYTAEFQPGARRFDSGQAGDFMALPMLEAALAQLLEWGVEQIAGTMAGITGRIEEGATDLGLLPAPAGARVAHMIGVRFPGGVPEGLVARLRESAVYVSVRGDSMRVAPYLFTTDEDIARLFAVVADAI